MTHEDQLGVERPRSRIGGDGSSGERGTEMTVSPRLLLGLYAIVPLGVVAVLVDALLFDGALVAKQVRSLRMYMVIFEQPHIIASLFIVLLDQEYRALYRKRMLVASGLIVGVTLALAFAAPDALSLVFAIATLYHVMAQQTGIAKMLLRGSVPEYQGWKWLSIGISVLIYMLMLAPFRGDLPGWITPAVGSLLLPLAYFGWQTAKKSKTITGKWYVWANVLMVAVAFVMLTTRYYFFVVFIPRFVHDLTAFAFYMVHDHNRNRVSRRNALARLLGPSGLPLVLLTPIAALIAANALTEVANRVRFVDATVLLMFGFLHYYLEGITWRRGGRHRNFIAVGAAR